MSAHIEFQEHFAGTNKLFISVWGWLLLLTGLEVFLGSLQPAAGGDGKALSTALAHQAPVTI